MGDMVSTEKKDNIAVKDEFSFFSGNIKFISGLLRKYDWDSGVKKSISAQLNKVKEKNEDKKLNLCVVGEFGTGKSSFINAMLRHDEFLVSSALQGTTVAATVIEHGECYAIVREYKSGVKRKKTFDDFESFREASAKLTTDGDSAQKLKSVTLELPDSPLKDGFRIIDTPGTNSNEAWHEQVTIDTVNEIGDMSILIVDANKPLTESFCSFVRNNFSDILDRCVFVVTRIDMIRKRERQGVLEYLQTKIASEFELENPVVLPYSSREVLEYTGEDEPSELAAMSLRSESIMFERMLQQKKYVQAAKLLALSEELYVHASSELSRVSEGYTDELDFLVRSRQVNLAPFLENQKGMCCGSFRNVSDGKRKLIAAEINTACTDAIADIFTEVDNCANIDALKKFTQVRLEPLCTELGYNIISKGDTLEFLENIFRNIMEGFHSDFEQLFSELNILSINFEDQSIPDNNIFIGSNDGFSSVSNYVEKKLSTENKVAWSGAAVGAAVGTAIFPILGTLVGGFLGMLGGLLFAPNTKKVKEDMKKQLEPALKQYVGEMAAQSMDLFNRNADLIEGLIRKEIDRYADEYKDCVNKKIEDEEKKIAEIEAKVTSIRSDINAIEMRKVVLKSMNEELHEMKGSKNNGDTV